MGSHINKDGQFQSDKYPTCPAGKVPLSVKDRTAQDLLWTYAQRRREVDPEFADDLEKALRAEGFESVGAHFCCGNREPWDRLSQIQFRCRGCGKIFTGEQIRTRGR